jgi:acetoin utilization deacetylase AcuC-like enzyme
MEKYDLLPQQLLYEGTCKEENFFKPEIPNNKYFFMVHDPEYVSDLMNITLNQKAARKIGFPLNEDLIAREMIIADGTIKASEFALKYGIAMNIAGGTHHAFTNKGEGFCMLNDQAIGARYLQNKELANKILIVDLDVHQGNGTASIFKENNNVFTLSFHGKKNYPFKKEKSDLDVEFLDKTNDEFYLNELKEILPKVFEKFEPDFVFYLAGVDVLENDKLGRLSMTIEGCKQRDRFVLELCKKNNLPLQISMGGGYSVNIKDILEAHSNTYRLAQEIYF